MPFDPWPRRLDERAVRNTGRARRLAGPAAEAQIEMSDHLGRRVETPLLETAHEMDAAAR